MAQIVIKAIGLYKGHSCGNITIAVDSENLPTLVGMYSDGLVDCINYDAADVVYNEKECWWIEISASTLRAVSRLDNSSLITVEL